MQPAAVWSSCESCVNCPFNGTVKPLWGATAQYKVMSQCCLPAEQALVRRILAAATSALGDMHAAGVLCVDLKPENLVLDVHQVGAAQRINGLKLPISTCHAQNAWCPPHPSAHLFGIACPGSAFQ